MKKLIETIRNKLTGSPVLRILGWVFSAGFVLFIWALLEMYNFRSPGEMLTFITERPLPLAMGLGLTAILYGTFLLAFRKSWVAALVLGVLYQAAGIVNYLKQDLNGDPFVPMDFTMTGKMGELLSFVKVMMPWWAYLLPVLLTFYIVALWLWRRELPRGVRHVWYRVAGCVALPLLLIGFLHPNSAEVNFAKFGMNFMDTSLQSSNYRANGFLGGFYLNIATMRVAEGYCYE